MNFVIHYLDDFLVMGAPESDECATALERLLKIFKRLDLPMAMDKLEGPDTTLVFRSIELDTITLETRLPQQKTG